MKPFAFLLLAAHFFHTVFALYSYGTTEKSFESILSKAKTTTFKYFPVFDELGHNQTGNGLLRLTRNEVISWLGSDRYFFYVFVDMNHLDDSSINATIARIYTDNESRSEKQMFNWCASEFYVDRPTGQLQSKNCYHCVQFLIYPDKTTGAIQYTANQWKIFRRESSRMGQLILHESTFSGYMLVLSHKNKILGCTSIMPNGLQYWRVYTNGHIGKKEEMVNGSIIFVQIPSERTTRMLIGLRLIPIVSTEDNKTMCLHLSIVNYCDETNGNYITTTVTFSRSNTGHETVNPSVLDLGFISINENHFVKSEMRNNHCNDSKSLIVDTVENSLIHTSCEKISSWTP